MATDGVKIIDGDSARDTYQAIMNLYDDGADAAAIYGQHPLVGFSSYDDFDTEVCVTAAALALWEIGLLTAEQLAYVHTVVERGAGVAEWTEECGPKEGQARQRVLTRFLHKISQPPSRIRPRRKYRPVTNLYFQADDVLTFQVEDGQYRAFICTSVEQVRGRCDYSFVPTTYQSATKPTPEAIQQESIMGKHLGSGCDRATTQQMQPGIERLWALSQLTYPFLFSLDTLVIGHKDLSEFKDRFEVVGTLVLLPGLKKPYGCRYPYLFQQLIWSFSDLAEYVAKSRYALYPLAPLLA